MLHDPLLEARSEEHLRRLEQHEFDCVAARVRAGHSRLLAKVEIRPVRGQDTRSGELTDLRIDADAITVVSVQP